MSITATTSTGAVSDSASQHRPASARWARPGLFLLLTATAVLYLWGLGTSGWANEFYAAATQAGTKSWKALLFGSLDAGNAITVDKPPAALWVTGLSGRIFGFNSWSLLAPQALMGVGSVALLAAAVRRWSGPGAGLLAGSILAVTPVAAVMFRFDNPDALLVLMLVAAAYCVVRATDGVGRRTRGIRIDVGTLWLSAAGVALGIAFLTKLLQAFLILPALGLVFLVAASGSIWSRLGRLLVAAVVMVVSGGWYVALVALWPAGSRPYIGGSTDNSMLELALGYNGLGRVVGGHGNPSVAPGPVGAPPRGLGVAFGGPPGIGRLFGPTFGCEVSWLLPAALIGLVVGLWYSRRAPRTDRFRAGLLLWGGWLLGTGVVFSFMSGIIHPYYAVALAPGIAGSLAITITELRRQRDRFAARMTQAVLLVTTGVWSFVLLNRVSTWLPWLRWTVLIGCLGVAVAWVAAGHLRRFTVALAAAALLTGAAGSTAFAIATASRAQGGGIPTSGPATEPDSGLGGPPPRRAAPPDRHPDGRKPPSAGAAPRRGAPPSSYLVDNRELAAMLTAATERWAAAMVGSMGVNLLELRTGAPIMAIGGFSGGDPSPTPAQFRQYVAAGAIRYFILDEDMEEGPHHDTESVGSEIRTWVRTHFVPITVGGVTVYDLTARL